MTENSENVNTARSAIGLRERRPKSRRKVHIVATAVSTMARRLVPKKIMMLMAQSDAATHGVTLRQRVETDKRRKSPRMSTTFAATSDIAARVAAAGKVA